ncbi:MAG: primosomal protein N' [Thermodesulfobacteriota bacterium]
MALCARVAVLRPLSRTFHYRIPEHLRGAVAPGVRCSVPFGRTATSGFVTAIEEAPASLRLKDLLEVLDPEPCLPPDLLELGLWLASYYHHFPGEALAALVPPSVRASAEVVYAAAGPAGGGESREPGEQRLLDRLRSRGEIPARGIRPAEQAALTRLLGRGEATRSWRVGAPPAPPGEEWFSLAPGAPAPGTVASRSPRQAQVLEGLQDGPQPAAILRARGVSREALARAVARGWVSRARAAALPAAPSCFALSGQGGVEELSGEQVSALQEVSRGLDAGAFAPILLQGVTGSGKTEVYIRAVEQALERDRGAIVLVPEIALTPQIVGRFCAAFGDAVALFHSALGERERRLQWLRVHSGEIRVAVGARSAVFAPVRRLGLVVVDEEHEPSYKQEEGLRYHAKHAALVRARACGAVALLGSATPDVETFHAADTGRYARAVLPRRVLASTALQVEVVDLRQEESRRRARVLLSEPLRLAVAGAVERGEQALLFLNRRGFSPALVCRGCGEALGCRRCSIALTLHRHTGAPALLCHYCGGQRVPPPACPACGKGELAAAGAGTQRLLEEALAAWPGARVVRLDRDTVRQGRGTAVLGAFSRGEADVLVGTQMVAKGHHFPRLTVVGVVDADLSLHFPDFRAGERTFQTLMQVAGRAGREVLAGRVFFQTRNPHHEVLAAAVAGDYEAFARAELRVRREAGFPPFRRLALLRISGPEAAAARTEAEVQAGRARALAGTGVEVLGPAPAPLERLRGRWRFQVLLKGPGPEAAPLQRLLRRLLDRRDADPPAPEVRVQADVDPVNLL